MAESFHRKYIREEPYTQARHRNPDAPDSMRAILDVVLSRGRQELELK